MGLKKCAFPPKVEIWLHRLCLLILLVQKNTEFIILFAKNLGKICSRRICGIARKFRVISPETDEAMFFSTQRKRATSNGTLYAGVDYNLTLCSLQSRLQHIIPHGQPYASRLFSPVRDLGFGLCLITTCIYTVLCFGQ